MENIKTKNILNEKPLLALVKLSSPIFLGMIIHTLYLAVDLYFIGTVSSKYQASVGFIYPILFLFYGFQNGIGSGLTSIIGNRFGSSKFKEISFYERTGLHFMLFLGLIFFIVIVLFGKKILSIMGVPDDLLIDTFTYLCVISSSSVFDSFNIAIRSIYTGKGNSKTPMMIISAGVILNIFIDPFLIYYYGFIGAGIATALCTFLTSLLFIYKIYKHKFVNIKLINFFNKNLIDIVNIGVPASLSMIVISFGSMVINYVLQYYSIFAVAAFQIISRVEDVFFIFVISTSYAGMTLVSMYLGAKKDKMVSSIIFKVIIINTITASILAFIFFNYSAYYISFFSKDDKILEVARSYFKYISYMYPLIAFGLSTGRLLQGFGSSLPLLAITCIRVLLIIVPLSYLFSYLYNEPIEYIWYSMMLASIVSALVALIWLKVKLKKFSTKILK